MYKKKIFFKILIITVFFVGIFSIHSLTKETPVYAADQPAETQPITFNLVWTGWVDPALIGQEISVPFEIVINGNGTNEYITTTSPEAVFTTPIGTDAQMTFDLPKTLSDGTPVEIYSIYPILDGRNPLFSIGRNSSGTSLSPIYRPSQRASTQVEVTVNIPSDVQAPTTMPTVIYTYPDYYNKNRTEQATLAQGSIDLALPTMTRASATDSIYRGIVGGRYPSYSPYTGKLGPYLLQATLSDNTNFTLRPLDGNNTSGNDTDGWSIVADLNADSVVSVTFDPTDKATDTTKTVIKLIKGEKVASVPTPTPVDGYIFLGWSSNGKEIIDPATIVTNENTIYTAQYKPVSKIAPVAPDGKVIADTSPDTGDHNSLLNGALFLVLSFVGVSISLFHKKVKS